MKVRRVFDTPSPTFPETPPTLNGVNGATGTYLDDGLTWAQLADGALGSRLQENMRNELARRARQGRMSDFAPMHGVDPNDLTQAGWSVVFPQVEPGSAAEKRQNAIQDALAPLLRHRQAQAAERYQIYRDASGYAPQESKTQYLARLGAGPGLVNPDKIPYYMLLVASPQEISYRVQHQLDVQYAVGRIHFEAIEDYARYAESVIAAETGKAPPRSETAFFGVANPDDRATQLSHDALVIPLADFVEAKLGSDRVTRILGEHATRDRLKATLANRPAFLLTASHGVGFPSSDPRQRAQQGALLCQDWPGPQGALSRSHYFAGEDLDENADLRGLISFHFACYGAATPRMDEFVHRQGLGQKPKILAQEDFVARLPQAMLSHANGGALATVGHVDRAWSCSFMWLRQGQWQRHTDAFQAMLGGLLQGHRLGFTMEAFNQRYAELAADLASRLEEVQFHPETYDVQELTQMWVYSNDARNYTVFGDPAVRLEHVSPSASV